ncbi:hypothetical protein Tco_1539200 [Tanacetum coccineum]
MQRTAVCFDKSKDECYNCHNKDRAHFARECRIKGNQDNRRRDAWNSKNKDGSRTGKKEDSKALVTIDGEELDTEVTSCLNECRESYAKLKKLYDAQREQLSDASKEIKAYTQGLKKVEAQLVAHQQGQLWYEQRIKFMKIDLDDKTDVLTYHKKLLAEAMKEKEDLKAKVEKWHNPSKNLGKLLNTQMSANDKFGLGKLENQPLYDMFVTAEGMHVSDAPIIEEYESDSEDEYVSIPTKEQETPSFANQQVKTPRETVKNQFTHSINPKVDKKVLGYGFTARACFVCGSLNHLIRDCNFHEKRMAKQAELNNRTGKIPVNTAGTSGTKNISTARHNFNRQAVLTSTARKVNTVKPIVNKVNTAKVNAVSAVGGKKETVVKPSADCNWRPQRHNWQNDYPHRALKNKGIVDSGCCRRMTGNKAYLAEY